MVAEPWSSFFYNITYNKLLLADLGVTLGWRK